LIDDHAAGVHTMTRIDVHQHVWTPQLVEKLSERRDIPFVRRENGLTVLYLARERPYVIDSSAGVREARAELLQIDSVDEALVCISSPIGIESLPREESLVLLDAYHDGALELGRPFGVWGAIALDQPDPGDVDQLLDRGCVGISLPAGALADASDCARVGEVLERLEARDAPLFVHPGPGLEREAQPARHASLGEPLWWPALTSYVSELQAAWLAFIQNVRVAHPRLRVIFAALAGLAPLHVERLAARGGPAHGIADERIFYDTSSYGPSATRALAALVGSTQLLYGSDRPVLDTAGQEVPLALGWELLARNTISALGGSRAGAADLVPQPA
jgi:hypothetical protein